MNRNYFRGDRNKTNVDETPKHREPSWANQLPSKKTGDEFSVASARLTVISDMLRDESSKDEIDAILGVDARITVPSIAETASALAADLKNVPINVRRGGPSAQRTIADASELLGRMGMQEVRLLTFDPTLDQVFEFQKSDEHMHYQVIRRRGMIDPSTGRPSLEGSKACAVVPVFVYCPPDPRSRYNTRGPSDAQVRAQNWRSEAIELVMLAETTLVYAYRITGVDHVYAMDAGRKTSETVFYIEGYSFNPSEWSKQFTPYGQQSEGSNGSVDEGEGMEDQDFDSSSESQGFEVDLPA